MLISCKYRYTKQENSDAKNAKKNGTGGDLVSMYEQPDLYNADCMEAMRYFPDKFFDLAVIDPPYGNANDEVFRTGGTWADKYGKKIKTWDNAPGEDFFKELFRVSKNQVIWGGNYFTLPPTRCFLVWEKTIPENFTMAMAEYAWTSFNGNAKIYRCASQGTVNDKRFHPTQKPISPYQWILNKYANEGDKILDTHCGSASSLIACHRAGLDGWGFEIDTEYYKKAKERLDRERRQVSMFELI